MINLGPNALNLHSYNTNNENNEQEQSIHSPSSLNSQPNTYSQTIQQMFNQFVQDYRDHQDMINDLIRNISHISQQRSSSQIEEKQEIDIMSFYPKFWVNSKYVDDEEKKAVVHNDKQFNGILKNLQKHNSILKQQLKGYYFEYSKKTLMTEALMAQNRELRKFLIKANKNLKSLLVCLKQSSTNQNPKIEEINLQLNRLKQENVVLLDHHKQLKYEFKQREEQQVQLARALDDKIRAKIKLQSQMREMNDEEQSNGKELVLEGGNKKEVQLRENYLLTEKQRLLNLKSQYSRDRYDIESQSTACQTRRSEFTSRIKPTLQAYITDHQRTVEQYQIYCGQLEKQTRDIGDRQQEIGKKEVKLREMESVKRKLQRKQKEYLTRLQQSKLKREESEREQLQLLSKMDILEMEIKQLEDKTKQSKKNMEMQVSRDEIDVRTFEKLRRDEVDRWSQQLEKSRRSSNKRIMTENYGLDLQDIEIKTLASQIQDGNAYIQHLLQQIRERKQSQDISTQMRNKIYSQTQQPIMQYMQPIHPMQQMQPMQPIHPMQSMQQVQSMQPIQRVKSLQSFQPMQFQSQQSSRFYPIENDATQTQYYPINPETLQATKFSIGRAGIAQREGRQKGVELIQARSNPERTKNLRTVESGVDWAGRLPIQLGGDKSKKLGKESVIK